jgi:hypothetical protein
MTIATLGFDLGKVWIFLVGLDHDGRIVLQRPHAPGPPSDELVGKIWTEG